MLLLQMTVQLATGFTCNQKKSKKNVLVRKRRKQTKKKRGTSKKQYAAFRQSTLW